MTTQFLFITIISGLFSFTSNEIVSQNILTKTEVRNLLILQEEEKLARDVYLYNFEKYGTQIFSNIANSEENHINHILRILDKYGINDPTTKVKGEFLNSKFQQLYEQLILQSSKSLIDALKVGATIEDLDIYDIDSFIKHTDNVELLNMYNKLNCGSKKHIRAFNRELVKNNSEYIPQYISIKNYKKILKTKNQSCDKKPSENPKGKGKEKGKGKHNGQGKGCGNGQNKGNGRGRSNSW